MAPLYKRYIPPKAPTESAATISQPQPKIESPAVQETPDKKRKRERSKDEVAERKAKKLRKKGVDPATVQDVDASVVSVDAVEEPALQAVRDEKVDEPTSTKAKGEFSHIKNDKKRHKLEKEARNARKAAEKAAKLAGDNVEQEGAHIDAPQDETQDEVLVVAEPSGQPLTTENTNAEHNTQRDELNEKPKRKKRRKDATEDEIDGQDTVPEGSMLDAQDVGEAVQDTTNGYAPKLKKRRHKLEAVLAESQTEEGAAQDEDDEEHLRNHTAMLDKFQKSVTRSQHSQQEEQFDKLLRHTVVRDLELPEPDQEPTPEFRSELDTLPEWLAKPTMVSNDSRATFGDLNIRQETVAMLSQLGFNDALPVQQGLIPLLLQPGMMGSKFPPGTEAVLPDVGVSAPTGSGKTIAYLLPVIEALHKAPASGRLTALVIVPTRELVVQVAAVADSLTKGSNIRVGMATGTGKFKTEQDKLIKRSRRYDPEGYRKLMEQAKRRFLPSDDDDANASLDESEDLKTEQHVQDAIECLVEHVPTYESAVDLLVATPGRLLEHVNNTLGFNLVHLQWLVIDEADKLLDNQYEGFLESLNSELTRARTKDEQDARECYLRSKGMWDEQRERRLRKVVLSATMTRDISKLSSLKLRLPKMVVVRGSADDTHAGARNDDAEFDSDIKESADGFELPRTLVEYCVPVGDGSEKPLVAVELLSSRIFKEPKTVRILATSSGDAGPEEDDESSSESDESSIVSSDESSLSSDTDSSSDESEDEQEEDSTLR